MKATCVADQLQARDELPQARIENGELPSMIREKDEVFYVG